MAERRGLSLDEFYDLPEVEDIIAAWEVDQERCPHHGGPLSECPDDEKDWFPQLRICQPAMQLAAANRLYDLRHKDKPYHDGLRRFWAEEPSRLTPFHYRDGVTIWMSKDDLTPDDDFLGQRPAQWPSVDGPSSVSESDL